jgi:hypothetical protein
MEILSPIPRLFGKAKFCDENSELEIIIAGE